MHRITDVWSDLSRREQLLAAGGIACLVVVLLYVVFLRGGDETGVVDASTTAAAEPMPPLVTPTPGMIVAGTVQPTAAEPAKAGSSFAPVQSSGGGGSAGPSATAVIAAAQAEADRRRIPDKPAPGAFQPPVVSDAVKAAGRELERIAEKYKACIATRDDIRPCVNVIENGVTVQSDWHADGEGITFTITSADSHRLDLTIMPKGQDCRVLDKGDSCDGWVSR